MKRGSPALITVDCESQFVKRGAETSVGSRVFVGTRIIEKSVKVSSPKVGLIVADEAASSLRISAVARDSSSTPGAKDEPATLASANSCETD